MKKTIKALNILCKVFPVLCIIASILLCFVIFDFNKDVEAISYETLEIGIQNIEEQEELNSIKEVSIVEETTVSELKEVELTPLQKEASNVAVYGYSQLFNEEIYSNLNEYTKMLVEKFNEEYDMNIDYSIFLALFKQESMFKLENIAQISRADVIDYDNYYIEPKKTVVGGIEWTIVNFYAKYNILLDYRKTINPDATISEWYILKIHNSGCILQNVREKYSDKYPLTFDGDNKFIKDFESFEKEGKEMFKYYLTLTENEKALAIKCQINDTYTYEDYISSEYMYSDIKYCENIKSFL